MTTLPATVSAALPEMQAAIDRLHASLMADRTAGGAGEDAADTARRESTGVEWSDADVRECAARMSHSLSPQFPLDYWRGVFLKEAIPNLRATQVKAVLNFAAERLAASRISPRPPEDADAVAKELFRADLDTGANTDAAWANEPPYQKESFRRIARYVISLIRSHTTPSPAAIAEALAAADASVANARAAIAAARLA